MDEIKTKIRELLKSGKVDLIIGYKEGKISLVDGSEVRSVKPVFLTKETETDLLIWNRRCVQNLVTYLTRKENKVFEKIGIFVKPCELKAIHVLSQENQIDRQKLFIIGLSCDGIIGKKLGADTNHLAGKCVTCRDAHEGAIAKCGDEEVDLLIENLPEGELPTASKEVTITIQDLENMSREDRLAFWQKQFQKCLRCYACRSACPLCYCEQCITDMSQPQWIDKSPHLKGNFLFHLVRAFHLAGRCIGCEECERVCPMGIPLMLLNKKMIIEVKQLYDYESGKKPDQIPVLSQFNVNDDESFIK
ncbi:MAG: Fe-S oxidoreductase [bacterium]